MFANQFGIGLVDNVPEIYLTPAELATPFGIEDWGRTVTIDTWSAAPRRRWPHAKYAQLVEAMARGGWRVIEVGKNEAPPIQSWKSFKNTMSLRQTAALIGKCSLHIGNDSGLAHIAAAMGTPQVTLFGIVPPENRAYWSTVGIWKPKLCHRECLGHERCLVLREVRAWDEYAPPLESFCAIPIDDVMEAVDVAVRRHGIK
jgi:ADP-heptose:LPS heptosyltransferase